MSPRTVTIVQASLLFVALALSTYVTLEAFRPPRPAPGPQQESSFEPRGRRGMRGMPQPERKLLATFDRDGDQVLNRPERAAALESLQQEPDFRRSDEQGERGDAGMRIAPGSVRTYPGASLYDPKVLRTIFLAFDSGEWQLELASFYRTDVDVPATVMVDGRTYRGLRPGRGARLSPAFDRAPARWTGILDTCTTSPSAGSIGRS